MDTPEEGVPPPTPNPTLHHKPISRRMKGFINKHLFSPHSITLIIILTSLSFLIDGLPFIIPNPVSIASQCTIVSTSVDIRSSKVCELGLLNYKAKNVFYPSSSSSSSHTSKFRCRYDYYWASIFKVEYREFSSGKKRRALAEAPKEALPIDCRPSFNVAWLTTEKFKINETYNCRYTPGISEVDIYSDSLFNCHSKDPSTTEMMKRYSILLTRILYSLLFEEGISKHVIGEVLAGMFVGIFTGLISFSLISFLQTSKSKLAKPPEATSSHSTIHRNHVKQVCLRACFLVVYLSLMGWLTIQYGKMVGLTKIFTNY